MEAADKEMILFQNLKQVGEDTEMILFQSLRQVAEKTQNFVNGIKREYNDSAVQDLTKNIDKVKEPESHASGSLVDIEPVYHRGTHDVDEVQENVQNGDLVPEYQDDAANVDGHVDDFVHQEQEVPSQVPVDHPRRSVRERIPSTRYSSSQYVLLTEGGENMSLMKKLWRVSKRDNGLSKEHISRRGSFYDDDDDSSKKVETPILRARRKWYSC
nr:Retrovirus-related Pol polyprotein from transposon TNT 1-94 [Ipomoea batatas]